MLFPRQELFPEKLAKVERECLTVCLPDVESIKEDVVLDEAFFDHHILRLHDEGWYRGTNAYSPLIIEKQGCGLKLVSGPDYQPSFQKGLYNANILKKVLGVNKVHTYIIFL